MRNRAFLQPKWLIALVLGAATVAVFWEVTSHPFVNYDDNYYVTDCLQVQGGLAWANLAWAFKTGITGNWIPLTWLTHILDYQMYGRNAGGHHFSNLLIHVANSVLLYLLLNRLTAAMWRSAIVAALFAMHPLNVESVAWISERKNLLCTLFWILAIWAYSWYARRPGWKRYIVILLIFGLALMAKSMVVTLPFVLLLLDYWPLGRTAGDSGPSRAIGEGDDAGATRSGKRGGIKRRLVLEKVPFLLLAAADGILTVKLQQESEAVSSISFGIRVENALVSYSAYLAKTIWPARLAVLYPHPKSHLPVLEVSIAVIALVCISMAAALSRRRFKYVGVGWLWFVGTLVPVIGIIQAGSQSMADRYAYIPLIGIFIIAAWGLTDLLDRYKQARDYAIVGAVCLIFALVIVTRIQIGYWSSSVALWDHARQVTENNYIAYNNLGEALLTRGMIEEAGPWLYKSAELEPDQSNVQMNLGSLALATGRVDDAIAYFKRAIELDSRSCDAYNKAGAALLRKGLLDESVPYLTMALKLNPGFAPALANMGVVLDARGEYGEAAGYFEGAIHSALDPGLGAELRYIYGMILAKHGDLGKAAVQFRDALRLKPDYSPASEALTKIQGGNG
jgi:Flp pilus assembly protein TadD